METGNRFVNWNLLKRSGSVRFRVVHRKKSFTPTAKVVLCKIENYRRSNGTEGEILCDYTKSHAEGLLTK
jgi:hypothetical protein